MTVKDKCWKCASLETHFMDTMGMGWLVFSCDAHDNRELYQKNLKLRAENARLREALKEYTFCRHVGNACAAECWTIARDALTCTGNEHAKD